MDICQVETGLLKKKPCGQPGVTHCLNCEQALCSKHAVPQLNEGGHKTGKFMCKECDAARKAFEKNVPQSVPEPKKPAEETAKPAAPGAPAATAPAAKQAPKAAPAEAKVVDDGGALEFTPSKK